MWALFWGVVCAFLITIVVCIGVLALVLLVRLIKELWKTKLEL